MFEPRLVDLTNVNDTTHPNFSQVIYDINHLVRDVESHSDTLLIFEIQTPVPKAARGSVIDWEQKNTGYSLLKEETQYRQDKFQEDPNDPNNPPTFQTYAWSCIDLFNFKHELKRGTYKVPIYKPPTIINLDT